MHVKLLMTKFNLQLNNIYTPKHLSQFAYKNVSKTRLIFIIKE